MATETTTAPALDATPAAAPATDLSALTTMTAEEPASTDHHDGHDDSNDTSSDQEQSKKRSSSTADLKDGAPPAKVTKRRAARACVSCRARKVRCDVVEGAPCGNCRWDNVDEFGLCQPSSMTCPVVWDLRASHLDPGRGIMRADQL
ncbi:cutinase transcription factor 1 beta [Colletotrichum liriopes]|uniref:Cutinase transcription factor 1 beta n=1 Tax=Colletotrichum liriopes TaxID=708192 RepID=A0AA37GIU4_9PEZI|nr:cutinase transcription factor 1 beta [Colletotrichum liriopes]